MKRPKRLPTIAKMKVWDEDGRPIFSEKNIEEKKAKGMIESLFKKFK